MAKGRGRHRSTDKEGKRTIAAIEAISGVEAVFINRSIGGKSVGRSGAAGDFKLQGKTPGGFRGILQTSKGIQEIFIRVVENANPKLRDQLLTLSV
ncbi:MAG: hypothetical protein VX294_15380 [Candidatus Latescibacterota bacterium]|nr:hypothetical protein [Candidatus Latescibacterota bacterium]